MQPDRQTAGLPNHQTNAQTHKHTDRHTEGQDRQTVLHHCITTSLPTGVSLRKHLSTAHLKTIQLPTHVNPLDPRQKVQLVQQFLKEFMLLCSL